MAADDDARKALEMVSEGVEESRKRLDASLSKLSAVLEASDVDNDTAELVKSLGVMAGGLSNTFQLVTARETSPTLDGAIDFVYYCKDRGVHLGTALSGSNEGDSPLLERIDQERIEQLFMDYHRK